VVPIYRWQQGGEPWWIFLGGLWASALWASALWTLECSELELTVELAHGLALRIVKIWSFSVGELLL